MEEGCRCKAFLMRDFEIVMGFREKFRPASISGVRTTPTVLCPKAQGCDASRYPGFIVPFSSNPNAGCAVRIRHTAA
jgi:hypothetical protein